MRRVVRTALLFGAGAAAMLALDAVRPRRRLLGSGSLAQELLVRLRGAPVTDATVETRVRRTLARTARDPNAIAVSIEHGCVDLRGPIETRDRARIVRAVATVPGVDSVLDLMTEPHAPRARADTDAVRWAKRSGTLGAVQKTPPLGAGWYGPYGGRYVSETLIHALDELTDAVERIVSTSAFDLELKSLLAHYVGRPTPLTEATRLARTLDPSGNVLGRLFLKREDLCHTGAHKINNALGQILLATKMGKTRIIAETGAGQHGVATATACALFGLPCEVYMGEEDVKRQAPNVGRMKLLGAKVIPVQSGSRTLKDAMNEALRDWVTNVATTHYCIGSAAGPHPYPELVARFQSVIGEESRAQMLARTGNLPDAAVACIGGGSNAIGMFRGFLDDDGVRLYGIEAAGHGVASGKHAATLTAGRVGVLHGSRSYVLCDEHGQIQEAHSISAGLDYPGVGPQHSFLKDTSRASYLSATDDEALAAAALVARTEGILPALETSHAFAKLGAIAAEVSANVERPATLVICLSGRGDKDLETLLERLL